MPGLLGLVLDPSPDTWVPFAWLFAGAGLWFIRCLVDLGLTRRPILEPNLNNTGLFHLALGLLGLLLAETATTPVREAAARNPADPHSKVAPEPARAEDLPRPHAQSRSPAPPPSPAKRVVAGIAQVALVVALVIVGWRRFEHLAAGLAVATCYLLLPYTRIALVDSGQLVPSASIVAALAWQHRPVLAGLLLGFAAGWMPPALALVPLWAGYYGGRGALRFLLAAIVLIGICGLGVGLNPGLAVAARTLGARTLAEVGLLPGMVEAPSEGSLWSFVDSSYRWPVLIAYAALVIVIAFWPSRKNLGELIALSAALLVSCQFWYLDEGGALVQIYMPLVLLMMFRPNLSGKRPPDLAHAISIAGHAPAPL
jgi:hypothetical protein